MDGGNIEVEDDVDVEDYGGYEDNEDYGGDGDNEDVEDDVVVDGGDGDDKQNNEDTKIFNLSM